MKTIKNRKTKKLYRVTDLEAKMFVEGGTMFAYSTKGAWKSRQNTLKKLEKAKRREYFRKRRLAKTA